MRTRTMITGRCNPVYKPGRCGVRGWVQPTKDIVSGQWMYYSIIFNPYGNDLLAGPFDEYRHATKRVCQESARIRKAQA
jgi:hypothetical protein